MKKLLLQSLSLIVILGAFSYIQLYLADHKTLSIKGEVSTCENDRCFNSHNLFVKNVYTNTDIEAFETPDYSDGNVSPQICEDFIIDIRCSKLDITKLKEYKISNINQKERPNLAYMNMFVESPINKKIYFLYLKFSEENDYRTAYDIPLALISFNVKTKVVAFEGQLYTRGAKVKNMYISPKGNYILITDQPNPMNLPATDVSMINIFNLNNKTAKTYTYVENGKRLDFISWIDDNSFFYSISQYNGKRKETIERIFKIGTI